MRPNMRSSGVATAVAMVSGLAPGRFAETDIVGYSTSGTVATGRNGNASAPNRNRAMPSRDVATGRLMNRADIFINRAGRKIPGLAAVLAEIADSRHPGDKTLLHPKGADYE